VQLPGRAEKPIESFQIGDEVASFLGLGALEQDVVTYVWVHENRPTLDIDGLVATPEHRFLLPDGDWKRAGEFVAGDAWVRADGSCAAIRRIAAGPVTTVYNLEVARNKTYVAGGVRVHNPKS
jgi:hypothetical protein